MLSVDFSGTLDRQHKMKKTCFRGAQLAVTLRGGLAMDLEQSLSQFLVSRVRRKNRCFAASQLRFELVFG